MTVRCTAKGGGEVTLEDTVGVLGLSHFFDMTTDKASWWIIYKTILLI